MASESDQYVYMDSIEPQENLNLFEDKKYTYITDSNSNAGNFGGGQVQFNLETLNSQSQFLDLKESYIQLPIKLQLTSSGGTALVSNTVNTATLKSAFTNFVDSIQIVINGVTVQTATIYNNIDANFRYITESSSDWLDKYGPTLNIAPDSYGLPSDNIVTGTSSLDNSALNLSTTSKGGFNMAKSNNPGFNQRLKWLNNGVETTNLGKSILGESQKKTGKGNVAIGTGTEKFCGFFLATIKLASISDFIAKAPLMKGIKGFIYLNFNSSKTVLVGTGAAATGGNSGISTITNSAVYGRVCPAMLNLGTPSTTTGLILNASTVDTLTFTADVSASASTLGVSPMQSNAMLWCPVYTCTPQVERNLSKIKTIRYMERYVTEFSMTPTQSVNLTLTPGITNAKRLILYPYFTGQGDSGNTGFISNPLLSPLDSAPFTTSPYAYISQLQVTHGNKPLFNSPVNCDNDLFLQEISKQGLDGGQNVQLGSGILNADLYSSLYRYVTVDLGRRMGSEDGCSKAIQLSCVNGTQCPMTVIAVIWYEKELKIDTTNCRIEQTM